MAKKICQRCGEEKTIANYIAVNSIMHNSSLPICRQCLAKQIEEAYKTTNGWTVVDKICQWADVPFIPEKWEEIHNAHGKDALGTYFGIFKDQPYSKLNWQQYNEAYMILQEENRIKDALPTIKNEEIRKLKQKWGSNYDEEDLEYLENLHQGLLNTQNIVGALNEDQALKLCKISLIIEEKIRASEDFDKDLRAYDALSKLANLTPKVVKDANEFNSTGEVFAYLEKKGWINKYYDNAIRDEADFVLKDIKLWLQYLYVNETGIAEEIEQRISQLKEAAATRGQVFDEKALRDYIAQQQQNDDDLENEEFQIDVWGDK